MLPPLVRSIRSAVESHKPQEVKRDLPVIDIFSDATDTNVVKEASEMSEACPRPEYPLWGLPEPELQSGHYNAKFKTRREETVMKLIEID